MHKHSESFLTRRCCAESARMVEAGESRLGTEGRRTAMSRMPEATRDSQGRDEQND